MPEFCYVAMDSRGKETKGKLDVADQNEAIKRLKNMGYFPTRVEVAKIDARGSGKKAAIDRGSMARGLKRGFNIPVPGFGARLNAKSLVAFTRQLARLVD